MDIPQGESSCSCFKADLEFRMLVFVEGGLGEKPTEQEWKSLTNLTHMWRKVLESNPSHSSERQVLLPLQHTSSPLPVKQTDQSIKVWELVLTNSVLAEDKVENPWIIFLSELCNFLQLNSVNKCKYYWYKICILKHPCTVLFISKFKR